MGITNPRVLTFGLHLPDFVIQAGIRKSKLLGMLPLLVSPPTIVRISGFVIPIFVIQVEM